MIKRPTLIQSGEIRIDFRHSIPDTAVPPENSRTES